MKKAKLKGDGNIVICELSHFLASAKDKKPSILASNVKKYLPGKNENIVITYSYCKNISDSFFSEVKIGEETITYHLSRNGKTYYADSVPSKNFKMPKIGKKVSLVVQLEREDKGLIKILIGDEFNEIREWAENKGIYQKGDIKTQYIKLQEEAGELAKAILKNDFAEFKDAIGDCVVVLTNLAELGAKHFKDENDGCSIEDCINSAYSVIKNRTGKMENGTFVKNK